MFGFLRRLTAPGTTLPDRSSAVGTQAESNGMRVVETHAPDRNQAEYGIVNRPINPAPIYRHMMGPVYYPNGFDGFVGIFHVSAARVIPIYNRADYNGILPVTEQPTLTKPLPYK